MTGPPVVVPVEVVPPEVPPEIAEGGFGSAHTAPGDGKHCTGNEQEATKMGSCHELAPCAST